MVSRHSRLARGLEAAGKHINLEGARFGRMFPHLAGATYGRTRAEEYKNLEKLAVAMVSGFDAPQDRPDAEESGNPALYTYFGQFIDHDLTFDPDASFQKRKDPSARVDFRTPAFDLDNLYGRGPGDQPYMYDGDGKTLLLGDPLTLGHAGACDLQRNGAGRALIGDPRNDENAIVSQFQGLMIRFHNAMVARHPRESFERIQDRVRHHYQYVVANDFLPRIVSKPVLDKLRTNGAYDRKKIRFFTNFAPPYGTPYMPIEFSVAAYRLGHSMVRPGYRLNDATLLPIFPLPPEVEPGYPEGLTGFRRMIGDWGIDWGRFIDIDIRPYGSESGGDAHEVENFRRLQFAYRIDTALVDPLGRLPHSVAGNPPPSLAFRNLLRGREFKLPSGQTVAAAIGVAPLRDKDILIGQGVNHPKPKLKNIVEIGGKVFADNCPLWTYILAEAMHHRIHMPIPVTPRGKKIWTPQLGPVGGRIVAEVFLQLLFSDPGSYLRQDPHWHPSQGKDFRLKDLVRMALA
jgi:hypothetical protein